jgi:hypothetical protein
MTIPIYHITAIQNLTSIINSGGIMSLNRLREGKTNYTNIAYESIQDRRSTKLVPCGAGGSLHDYVPFYFAPRSPMLYTIHRGNVEGYSQGQQQILHLVTTAESVNDRGLAYVYTDGHAVMEYSDFYDDIEYLYLEPIIDWELMEARYWFDTEEDPDRKRRRQAEFLVYNFFPWHLVTEIGVINPTIQAQVSNLLLKSVHKPNILVRRDWYY